VIVVLFGLLAAALYGTSDFAGGVASRRANVVTVLMYSYPVGAILILAMLPFFPGHLNAHVALFGLLGGVAGVIGVLTMYALMAVAPMNVISPITALLAATVPVAFGVLTGDRPHFHAWFGIALGLFAIVLVSRTTEEDPHGRIPHRFVALACVAGLGFGGYFVFLARAGHGSGLWPLVISRIASPLVLAPVAMRRRAFARIPPRLLGIAVVTGACDALANLFFLLASRHGLLSVAGVTTSLYPAMTVVLAITVLHERTAPVQRVGLGLAAAAIVLITV
jgi:drug/metabolite transporter (DMT)-like permease